MSILGRLLGTAQTAARGAASGRNTGRRPGRGMARPVPRRSGYGRRAAQPAAGGGLGKLVGGILRRR